MSDNPARHAGETKDGGRRESALSELGRVLYDEMERLDPSSGAKWVDLTDREREFFRLCVEGVLARRRLVLVVRCRQKIPFGQESWAAIMRLPDPARGYQLSASYH